VSSGRGLCDGLITRPEESYRLWRVVVCDQETPKTRRLKPASYWVEENTTTMGCNVRKTNKRHIYIYYVSPTCFGVPYNNIRDNLRVQPPAVK
jgi:hypothetical protein